MTARRHVRHPLRQPDRYLSPPEQLRQRFRTVLEEPRRLLRLTERSPVERQGLPREVWASDISAAALLGRNRIQQLEERVTEWYEGEDLESEAVALLEALAALGRVLAAGGTYPASLTEYQMVGTVIVTANTLASLAERAHAIRVA
ncbi:MAG TPA: hypothetical protein VM778_01890 [Gemmatimonadota bacterium]|nr:hypothetical protein [Gemmatimonadota bacterium]